MNSLDFRSEMIAKLRAFETWAWKDSRENPEEYADMDFNAWLAMFNTYLENEVG